jgi:hypothetical protein
MIGAQDVKFLSVTPPAVIVDNASLTTTEIDTLGWDYATYIVYMGATDIAMTALAVTESDVTASGHANVTGLIWATSANIDGSTSALPTAGDDNTFQVAQINLVGRKRFLDLTATVGDGTAGQYTAVLCILSRGKIGPNTVAESGCNELLRV